MAPKKQPPKPLDVPPSKMLDDDSTPTKDMAAPVMTPPERRKSAPRETIEMGGGGSPCPVCGTIGTGVCPVDGHARGSKLIGSA